MNKCQIDIRRYVLLVKNTNNGGTLQKLNKCQIDIWRFALLVKNTNNGGETAQFNLFDILGNKVISTTLDGENSKTTLDIHYLAQGVYSYQIVSSDAKVFIGKLIKD